MNKAFTVAIDGPAGSGKSTAAKIIAEKLNLTYIDSGAVYRTFTRACLEMNINPGETEKIENLLKNADISLSDEKGQFSVIRNGIAVGKEIRTVEVSENVPKYSPIEIIRNHVNRMLRNFAGSRNTIMDGRDIGTVVLPDAHLKIYLTASAKERARRRFEEFKNNGSSIEFNQVLDDVLERDRLDMERSIAPLKKADDAVVVDTTEMNHKEVIDSLTKMIEKKMKEE